MGAGCCKFKSSSRSSQPKQPTTISSQSLTTPASPQPAASPAAAASSPRDRTEMDDLCESLQKYVGEQPRFEIKEFENFSKLVRAKVFLVKPKTIEEVQKVVRAAVHYKLKVCSVTLRSRLFQFTCCKTFLLFVGALSWSHAQLVATLR